MCPACSRSKQPPVAMTRPPRPATLAASSKASLLAPGAALSPVATNREAAATPSETAA